MYRKDVCLEFKWYTYGLCCFHVPPVKLLSNRSLFVTCSDVMSCEEEALAIMDNFKYKWVDTKEKARNV